MIVRHDRLRELRVRYDDDVVRQQANTGRPPVEIGDVTFGAAFELEVVADPDLAGHAQEHAGKEIRQRILQRERHRQAADAERREVRRNLETKIRGQ